MFSTQTDKNGIQSMNNEPIDKVIQLAEAMAAFKTQEAELAFASYLKHMTHPVLKVVEKSGETK